MFNVDKKKVTKVEYVTEEEALPILKGIITKYKKTLLALSKY